MIKIAIVGNIASGKSTVEKIIQDNGFTVYDTDKIAHNILDSNPKIETLFGTTNRKELAQIVFSNPEKLKLLESIIHPEVKNELLNIFKSNLDIVFISVPQLFEAGFENMFDKIIYITADKNLRKERLIKRNSLTPEEAQKRIDAQSENNKRERADFIIENNNSLKNLEIQILKILSVLI